MKSSTTSGTHKHYKPGQLVTINNRVYRITRRPICIDTDCMCCLYRDYERFDFCYKLPLGLVVRPILKHKG